MSVEELPLLEMLWRFAIAIFIGLLVGLERGWQTRSVDEGRRVAGMRTFALLSLYGAVSMALVDPLGPASFAVAMLGALGAVLVGLFLRVQARQDFGITSTVAALLVVLLGALAAAGQTTIAVSLAVVTSGLLSLKPVLHRWIRLLEPAELYAVLQLLLISVVVLPVLPNRGFGPWQVLNPYELWLMVVLVSSVSFSGYFSIKLLGPRRGLGWAALLGGLVSSTAVTITYSRFGKDAPRLGHALAYGILLACGIMFVRVLIVATVINRELALTMALPMAAMASVCFACAWWQWRSASVTTSHADATAPRPVANQVVAADAGAMPLLELRNPFELAAAVKFAALLAAIMLASKALESGLGDAGVYLLSVVSGLADVDPVTLSLGRMMPADITPRIAANGVLLAAGTNTLTKGCLAWGIGGSKIATRVMPGLLISIAAGVAVALR